MKFMKASGGNVFHGMTEDEKELAPVVELRITVGEKKLQAFSGGSFDAAAYEDYRIGLTIDFAKTLIETIQDLIKEAERQAEKIEVKND